jgi:hypothetical protein
MPTGKALYLLPHRALVETWVEDGVALDAGRVVVEAGRDEEAEEGTVELEQVPKGDLHPEPQYALLLPQ